MEAYLSQSLVPKTSSEIIVQYLKIKLNFTIFLSRDSREQQCHWMSDKKFKNFLKNPLFKPMKLSLFGLPFRKKKKPQRWDSLQPGSGSQLHNQLTLAFKGLPPPQQQEPEIVHPVH